MKSYVGIGHDECPICGAQHNEVVLLDRRLRNTLEHKQAIGISECPECMTSINGGFVAIVGIDESKSKHPYTPASVYRTGDVVWVKRDFWNLVFTAPAPNTKFAYCDKDAVEMLSAMTETVQ